MDYHREGYYLDLHLRLLDRVDRAYLFPAKMAWERRIALPGEFKSRCAVLLRSRTQAFSRADTLSVP